MLAVALKAYCATDANWDAHKLAKAMWTVVHEELRNKCQGRTSHLPIPQGTGATTPGTVGPPIGGGAMLLVRTAWTLGTPMPAGGGHEKITPATRTSQNITSGGSDDPH